ncbi:hypothetical protein E3N88_43492 [Mikania micrantha]|uniref:Uncharacterized protein n=1 Tax=Mikania micrantha TaxID=192012 RepID=A0A5N6LES5_9ASTR|nr:hypothetical protein E3N88_43492 [Mikania micrantha]
MQATRVKKKKVGNRLLFGYDGHWYVPGERDQGVEMEQGEEVINTPDVEIQERGDIYFFYRPKVNTEEPHSSHDVQKLYIVLRPQSGETSTHLKQQEKEPPATTQAVQEEEEEKVNIEKNLLLRLIIMGRKSLPDPAKRSRPFWGFVELVTTKIQDVKDALKEEEYDTKTRGHRHKPAARALGEGVYRILRHNNKSKKMHTHLVYKLEFPSEQADDQPQEDLNVEREASFVIQIKNPIQAKKQAGGQFSGLQRKKKATFPAHLQGQFGQLSYHAADPPDFLNYEGCEFLLISASDEIQEELGLEIQEDASCSDLVDTFGETASADALFRGIWV